MWKKIKAFIPLSQKFFTRRNSLGTEHSRAADQIENKLTRNRELSKQSNGKINSISEEFRRSESRIESIAEELTILKAYLAKVQTIQKELESSTEKISTSFMNYKTDTTKDIRNLHIQNDILTFTIIALATYLIINSLALISGVLFCLSHFCHY